MSQHREPQQDFAKQLKERTKHQHTVSSITAKLCAPFIFSSPMTYRLLLASFYYIFKQLEEQMESLRLKYPKVGAIYFRQLLRTNSFEEDLAYYYGLNFINEMPQPSSATNAYIEQMRAAIQEDAVLVFAYCQALYMGMLLGGGPIIRGWIVKAFGVQSPTGCAIFDYSETISNISRFRNLYADSLNSVALTDSQKNRIIEQKKCVFQANNSIVKEVCASSAYRHLLVSFCARVLFVILVLLFIFRYFPPAFSNLASTRV